MNLGVRLAEDGFLVQVSVFLSKDTFSRALQLVMQECCLCFPENTEEEQLSGVRNHLVHGNTFSQSAKTGSLKFSATLGSKGQDLF